MKKQNDPSKTNYYSPYKERKTTQKRNAEAVESIPERCWWIRQYLRGVYNMR